MEIVEQNKNMTGVFIILPILNESANIAELLDRIEAALAGRPSTIGILDDGSTDGTTEYVRERMNARPDAIHLIERKKTLPGCQRGSALNALMHWGLAHTSHDVFIELDGDLSHQPEEMPRGIELLSQGFDVVIASKYLGGSREIERHPGRRMVSAICSQMARTALDRKIHDYSNGYRFYSRRSAEVIARYETRNGGPIYLSEVMGIWLREGMRIAEFPSVYVGRQKGSSKVIARDIFKAASSLFVIACRYRLLGFPNAKGEGAELAGRGHAAESGARES